MKRYIDPPGGWIYDFPKVLPEDVGDIRAWLIENGYPKSEIDRMGDHFYVTYWTEGDDDAA